jgi:predicted nucleic acid-binding protein
MILVDTGLWIDHLHQTEPDLVTLLEQSQVCIHPMIIGELALCSLRHRVAVLRLLTELPLTPVAGHSEVLRFVEAHQLYGIGLSLVDAHLLAAVRLRPATRVWTRDRSMAAAAERLDLLATLP